MRDSDLQPMLEELAADDTIERLLADIATGTINALLIDIAADDEHLQQILADIAADGRHSDHRA